MPGTQKRFGPAYMANAATNVYTPPASTIWLIITRIRVVNKDASVRTFSAYIGATGGSAGGTEIAKDQSLTAAGTAGSEWNWYGRRTMLSTDFLSAIASAASVLTVEVECEQYVVPS